MTVATLALVLTSCEKSMVLNAIPAEIQSYVTAHFPSHTIIQVVKDVDDAEVTYEAVLSDGVFLEFNRRKEIIEIKAGFGLPASVIPDNIRNYVNANYPDNLIVGWELEDNRNQQVDLNNGLELLFDRSGNFIRADS